MCHRIRLLIFFFFFFFFAGPRRFQLGSLTGSFTIEIKRCPTGLNKTKNETCTNCLCGNIFLHNRHIKLCQTVADQISVYIDLSASAVVSRELMLLFLLRYGEGLWAGKRGDG